MEDDICFVSGSVEGSGRPDPNTPLVQWRWRLFVDVVLINLGLGDLLSLEMFVEVC